MNDRIISRFAVILFAVIMAVFGLHHFSDPENLAIIVPSFLPGSRIWVYLVGSALILAAIAFVLNKQVKLAGYLLALLLVIFVLTIHLRGYLQSGDKEMQSISFINMLKDLGLAACALLIASMPADKKA
jgi:uncharacterized membrane protein